MKSFAFLFALTLVLGLSACLDENFDTPPVDGVDPGITPTTSIAELKAMHTMGNFETIDQDIIIGGVVVADDASGNWYRTFVLQDETGGIEVLTDIADSYVLYPIGRQVFIRCKGLVLGDYNNLIQLGGYVTEDLSLGPIITVTDHIIKGKKVGAPAPKVLTIDKLSMNDVSTLIQLDNVQFVAADTARTFADPVTRTAYNRYLEDCNMNQVIVRTSGYASFAGSPIPNGGGTFVGVLSVFRNDFQFLIRSLDDLHLDGDRCSFDPCAGTNVVTVSSIDEDFQSGTNNANVELNGWTNIATKGTRLWIYKVFDNNVYVQATAFNDSNPEMECWLITPGIVIDAPKVLTFDSAKAFWTHDGLSVWISTDFVCDPNLATWQPLQATLANQSTPDHEWVASGDIDLSPWQGETVFIGFKYVGSSTSGLTTSFRIDNVVVE
ncbi:MAG: hypothetical protein KatS3mg030_478 [Saprospiraceae bacterium]|nr:MAG: hypothetical protein KatS3mg030_478 [Saprospiraceae bacterium]